MEALVVEACHGIISHRVKGAGKLAAKFKAEVTELVRQSITSVKEGDLEKKFENELEPKTQNHYYLDTYKKIMADNVQTVIDQCLAKHRISYFESTTVKTAICEKTVLGALVDAVSNLNSVGTSNTEQEAKDLHSMVQAYFKTSVKRFVDSCFQDIDRSVLQRLDEEVEKSLAGLADGEEDEVNAIFDEDQALRDKRAFLEDKVARLSGAVKLLVAQTPTVDEALSSILGSTDFGAIVRLMKLHSSSAEVQAHGCKVLAQMEGPWKVAAADGFIEAVVKAMNAHATSAAVQEHGCLALCGMPLTLDTQRVEVASKGGIAAVVRAIEEHGSSAKIQEAGCRALNNVAFSDAELQTLVRDAGAVPLLQKALSAFPGQEKLQQTGKMLLGNLALKKATLSTDGPAVGVPEASTAPLKTLESLGGRRASLSGTDDDSAGSGAGWGAGSGSGAGSGWVYSGFPDVGAQFGWAPGGVRAPQVAQVECRVGQRPMRF
mmetsp:Transcript_34814/g.81358  ORF Transcript_34814/g.81358 Transcript_34814/m.81358 type:complete len:490 (-) Transcript_34814:187-1656(-)